MRPCQSDWRRDGDLVRAGEARDFVRFSLLGVAGIGRSLGRAREGAGEGGHLGGCATPARIAVSSEEPTSSKPASILVGAVGIEPTTSTV